MTPKNKQHLIGLLSSNDSDLAQSGLLLLESFEEEGDELFTPPYLENQRPIVSFIKGHLLTSEQLQAWCGYPDPRPWTENLESLSLDGQVRITDLESVASLGSLKHLSCASMIRLSSLDALHYLPRLTHLNLKRCSSLTSLEGIEQCTLLKELVLSGCRKLQNLDFFSQLQHLETLDLRGTLSVDLTPLLNMPSLKTVKLDSRRHKQQNIIEQLGPKVVIQ